MFKRDEGQKNETGVLLNMNIKAITKILIEISDIVSETMLQK